MKRKIAMLIATVMVWGNSAYGATGTMIYYDGEYYQNLREISDDTLVVPDTTASGSIVIYIEKNSNVGGGSAGNPAYTAGRYYGYYIYNSNNEKVYLSPADVEEILADYADSIGIESKTYEYDDSNIPESIKDASKLNKEDVPKNKKPAVYMPDSNTNNIKVSVVIDSNVININGEEKTIDAIPYIQKESESTLVPLRFITEAFKGENDTIEWSQETKTAVIKIGDKIIKFTDGSNVMYVDGSEVSLGLVKAEIKGRRMYIPFRALAEAIGVDVLWDPETKTATFVKDSEDTETTEEKSEANEIITAELKKEVKDTIRTSFDKYEVGKENPYFKDSYMLNKKQLWLGSVKSDADKEYVDIAIKLYDALKLSCEKLNEYKDSLNIVVKNNENAFINENYDKLRNALIDFSLNNNTEGAVKAYNSVADVYNAIIDTIG